MHTVLKVLIETLLEEESNTEKLGYLDIVCRHGLHFHSTVKNLLKLSALEIRGDLNLEVVRIKYLLERLHELFTPLL